MKNLHCFLFLSVAILIASSCSGNKTTDEAKQAVTIDSVDVHGIQRMQVSKTEQTVTLKGKEYLIAINRMPSDSLPKVENQSGDVYADNRITLRITQGNTKGSITKTFTKRSFTSLLTDDFLSQSILEGMVFDKIAPTGFIFSASISFPQTDLYIPIAVTISSDGAVSMAKEELMEDYYPTDEAITGEQ